MTKSKKQGYVSLSRALKIVSEGRIRKPSTEKVFIKSALGRIITNDIYAPIDIPPRDKATVDGYAVISKEIFEASKDNPIMLKLRGRVPVGTIPRFKVSRGYAAFVATGAWMPHGADAVVMIEDTKVKGNKIKICSAVNKGENILSRGEDVRRGEVVIHANQKIGPFELGMLSALGISNVVVFKKPVIGVLSTGDEIQDVTTAPLAGKIYDINRYMIMGEVQEHGADALDLGIVPDNETKIKNAILEGLRRANAVFVSAGTSVGKKDLVPKVVDSLGEPGLLFHGVAMKPGRPTGFAIVNDKPILLLPGFPVSALTAFTMFGLPIIHKLLSSTSWRTKTIVAELGVSIQGSPEVDTLIRVKVMREGNKYVARPIREVKSSMVSGLTNADGFFLVPKGSLSLRKGDQIEIFLFR